MQYKIEDRKITKNKEKNTSFKKTKVLNLNHQNWYVYLDI